MRISRMAHASHIYQDKVDRFPVVVIPGINHMGYTTGRIPLPVAALDLKQEVTKDEGHQSIATAIANYIKGLVLPDSTPMNDLLAQPLRETDELVGPLIKSMLVEGSWHFQKPCNSDHPSPHCAFYPVWPPQSEDRTPSNDTDCVCGSAWVEQVAQPHVGDLEGYARYDVVDAFHDVRDTSKLVDDDAIEVPFCC